MGPSPAISHTSSPSTCPRCNASRSARINPRYRPDDFLRSAGCVAVASSMSASNAYASRGSRSSGLVLGLEVPLDDRIDRRPERQPGLDRPARVQHPRALIVRVLPQRPLTRDPRVRLVDPDRRLRLNAALRTFPYGADTANSNRSSSRSGATSPQPTPPRLRRRQRAGPDDCLGLGQLCDPLRRLQQRLRRRDRRSRPGGHLLRRATGSPHSATCTTHPHAAPSAPSPTSASRANSSNSAHTPGRLEQRHRVGIQRRDHPPHRLDRRLQLTPFEPHPDNISYG